MRDRSALNGSENVVAAPLKAGQLREDTVLLSPTSREKIPCAQCAKAPSFRPEEKVHFVSPPTQVERPV